MYVYVSIIGILVKIMLNVYLSAVSSNSITFSANFKILLRLIRGMGSSRLTIACTRSSSRNASASSIYVYKMYVVFHIEVNTCMYTFIYTKLYMYVYIHIHTAYMLTIMICTFTSNTWTSICETHNSGYRGCQTSI